MLTYFEERRRTGLLRELYKVRSWYLFGLVLVFRRWEQLTVNGTHATDSKLG
jgi:hypothetical protein